MTDKERDYYRNKYSHVNLCFAHGRGWDHLTLSAAIILDSNWPNIPFWLKHLWNWSMCRGYWLTKFGTLINKIGLDILIPPSYKFSQIKEKYGSLCLYCISTPKVIDILEHASHTTCEECGSNKDIGITTGWIKTLCKECGKLHTNWEPIIYKSTGNCTEIKYLKDETN
jgi:hypothetical protein